MKFLNSLKSLACRWVCHWTTTTILISIILISFNPFNIDNITAYASRDIFYRAWGVEYPVEKSPKIAVVILREESLGSNEAWPVKYSKHYAMLNALLVHKPKSVLIDIAFFDERDDASIDSLVHIFKKYNAINIPIYIAAAESETGAKKPIRSDLKLLADEGIINLVSIIQGRSYGGMVSYRLEDTDGGYTPASLKLYQDLCSDIKGTCCDKISPEKKELELWWALPPSPFNCRGEEHKQLCSNISSSALMRLSRLFLKGFLPIINIQEADPVPAAYHPTLYWEDLMSGVLRSKIKESGVLKDAVVFYGLDFSLIGDDMFNPVYSQYNKLSVYKGGYNGGRIIPSVYSHAMAFDNLMTLENSILTPAPTLGMSEQFHTVIAVIFTVILAALIHFSYLKILTSLGLNSRGFEKLGEILLYIALLSLPIVLAVIEFRYFSNSPANWIGGITAVNISHLLQKKFRMSRWFKAK